MSAFANAQFSRFIRMTLAISMVASCASTLVHAQTPEEKGLAIAQEMDRRDLGWGTSETVLTMTLRNRHGQTSTRELRIQSMEMDDPELGDRSLTVFSSPRDVDGTALLSHTKVSEPDDQWLYLPALKRVKRISSSNKSGSFMGSEFAFEDLTSQEVGKYTYKHLRDEPYEGQDCFVVERYPVYKNSGYTRQIVWIDRAEYRPLKIEFFDRKDSPLKTLVLSGYRQYKDRYWRALELRMENHQTGKSTDLKFGEFNFDTGLTEAAFTSSRLSRVR